MPFFDPIRIGAAGAADTTYTVDRSLRFNDDDSAYLDRTFGSASNRKTFTISAWIKLGNLGTVNPIFSRYTANSDAGFLGLYVNSNDNLYFTGWSTIYFQTNRLFRDPSAWYHIVFAMDTTQSTNTDRWKLYINGTQETSFASTSYPSQDADLAINEAVAHMVGKYSTNLFDGYIAELNFIDGLALTPASFGATDVITGQWNPKKYTGSYGTNGFYLNFSDNSGTTATTLGKDSSGNGNNFTPNNFSVSAGAGNDSVEDTPTNNFATLNSLNFNGNSPSNGNLQSGTAGTTGWRHTYATFAMPSSGKWYWEVTRQGGSIDGSNGICYGLADSVQVELTRDINSNSNNLYLRQSDSRYNNGTITSSHFAASSVGNVIQFAFDADTGSMWSGVNNTWTGANPSTGSSASWTSIPSGMIPLVGSYGSSNYSTINFGQQGFTYTPPTGYKALNSANLPDPTILLPNQHFNTVLYTGTGSDLAVTGVGFQADWVWIKNRSNAGNWHDLYDSVRGVTKRIFSNQTAAEQTEAQGLKVFSSDGFTVGNNSDVGSNGNTYVAWNWNGGDTDGKTYAVTVVSDSGNKYRFDGFGTSAVTLDLAEGGTYIFDWSDSSAQGHPIRFSTTSDGTHGGGSEYTTGVVKDDSAYKTTITVAASAPTLYYYCQNHSGMGGQVNTNSTLGSSNFDGSIQTTVKTNASAGFSIITYTGTGADATIGHGLGVAPNVAFTKKRSGTQNWLVKHSAAGSGKVGYLDLADGFDSSGSGGGIISDFSSSSNYSLARYNNTGNYGNVNESSATYVSYVFSEVSSYSKFGSYTGNGSSDGTFVFTGFRPAYVLIKATTTTENWRLFDNKRNTFNQVNKHLFPSTAGAESTETGLDFVANGFKFRDGDAHQNGSGHTYIYLAFSESPFKNARAR